MKGHELTWAWPRTIALWTQDQSSGKVLCLKYNSWEVSRIEQCTNWRDNIQLSNDTILRSYGVTSTLDQANIPHEQKDLLCLQTDRITKLFTEVGSRTEAKPVKTRRQFSRRDKHKRRKEGRKKERYMSKSPSAQILRVARHNISFFYKNVRT